MMKTATMLLCLTLTSHVHALMRTPERPQVTAVFVNATNVLHVFAVLEVRQPERFFVQLPARPVAQSYDGGVTFALAERDAMPPACPAAALTGAVRYAMTPMREREHAQVLWRSDDGGSTWHETGLATFIQRLEDESQARSAALHRSQVLWLYTRVTWQECTYVAVIAVYIIITAALLFRRDWFDAAMSSGKTVVVGVALFLGLSIGERYRCFASACGGESLPLFSADVLTVTARPHLFLFLLLITLLFLPNTIAVAAAYSRTSAGYNTRLVSAWQLATALFWAFLVYVILTVQLMMALR